MKKNKVDINVTKPTWIIYGTGERLEDPDFIDYYRLHKLDEILEYKLLGTFTEEGKYAVSPEIKPTLVGLKKLVTATDYGTIMGESELGCITLHFKVRFWHVENKGYASLYLVEHVDEDELVSFVAQYYANYDDGFTNRIRTAFNLLDNVDDYEDEKTQQIREYIEQQELKQSEREFVVELQSEYYILEMMEVLAKGGEKSKRILEKLKEAHETSKAQADKSKIYTKLRRKLDLMIMQEGGFKEIKKELPEEFPKAIQIFTKPVIEYDKVSERLDTLGAPKINKKEALNANNKKKGKSSASKPVKGKPIYKAKPPKSPAKKKKEEKKKDIMLGAKFDKIKVEPVIVSVPLNPVPPQTAEQIFAPPEHTTPTPQPTKPSTNISGQPTAGKQPTAADSTLIGEEELYKKPPSITKGKEIGTVETVKVPAGTIDAKKPYDYLGKGGTIGDKNPYAHVGDTIERKEPYNPTTSK